MESHLNTPSVRLQDAWISLGIFLGIFFGSTFISVFVKVESVFPGLSSDFRLDLFATIALLVAVAYCISHYGTIHAEEFILRKRDVVVLGIALLIVFWSFGLTVGRDGIPSDLPEELGTLTGFQYWGRIFKLTIIGPILEEILLRRFFLEILAIRYSVVIAVLTTISVDTVLHMHTDISLFVFLWHVFQATVFTLAYIKSRLGVAVLVHGFHNTLVLLLAR